eukprot:68594-Amphidinium_carterae.1
MFSSEVRLYWYANDQVSAVPRRLLRIVKGIGRVKICSCVPGSGSGKYALLFATHLKYAAQLQQNDRK